MDLPILEKTTEQTKNVCPSKEDITLNYQVSMQSREIIINNSMFQVNSSTTLNNLDISILPADINSSNDSTKDKHCLLYYFSI